MANEPFIDPQSRPDLTVDLNSKVGDLTARQLTDILGSSPAKSVKAIAKENIKEIEKLIKEQPEKFPFKEQKEHKDTADHKATKDHKDTTDAKNAKDHKESADGKNTKDHKDSKDHIKDHKEIHKELIKESKEIHKEFIKEIEKPQKDVIKEVAKESIKDEKEFGEGGFPGDQGDPAVTNAQGIDQLIQRVSGLEQQVATLQGGG